MTAKETIKLLKALKESGVTSFKSGDIEISFGFPSNAHEKPVAAPVSFDASAQAPEEIKHKVEEFTSLMKLSDTELLDRLFPDTAPESPEEAVQ